MEPIRSILPRVLSGFVTAQAQEAAAYRRLQVLYRDLPEDDQLTAWQRLELELAEAAWKLRLAELKEADRG